MKRVLGIFGILMMSCVYLNTVIPSGSTWAAADTNCSAPGFLGLKPWYAGLCKEGAKEIQSPKDDDGLVTFIWTIILNVLFDMLLLVGYVATGVVVYGGFLYITAQGDPGKIVKAKKTLTTATIGTAIVMLSSVIVHTATEVIGIDMSKGLNQLSGNEATAEMLTSILNWLYAAAGLVAVVYIVKGGVDYVMSQGDPGKIKKATTSLIYAVVGLVVVVLAAVITGFITNAVGGTIK